MDLATAVGLLCGLVVVVTLIFLGGDLRMFYDVHALIVIIGGVLAATLVRFTFSGILHGLPLGIKFAFSMRSSHPRELIDELTQIAEVVGKNGPMALENIQVDDSFSARASATSPTATTASSSRTPWSATGTSSCTISRRVRRSTARWAIAPPPGAWSARSLA
jgi:hypothetical protein